MRSRSPSRRIYSPTGRDEEPFSSAPPDPAVPGARSRGFTAVNGAGYARSASKPDEPMSASDRDSSSQTLAFRESSWRPAHHAGSLDRSMEPLQSIETSPGAMNDLPSSSRPPTHSRGHRSSRKRKDGDRRDPSKAGETEFHPDRDSHESPKRRRTTAELLDVAPGPSRREERTSSHVTNTEPSVMPLDDRYYARRVPTPPRSSLREPLRPPQPETEEFLQRSLAETLVNPMQSYRSGPHERPPTVASASFSTAAGPALVATSSPPAAGSRQPLSPERLPSPREDDAQSDANADEAGQEHEPEVAEQDPKKRKRQFSNRTKTGCHTCRSRKKKCDENKPVCNNCERGGFYCGGYGPKPPGNRGHSRARPVMPLTTRQSDNGQDHRKERAYHRSSDQAHQDHPHRSYAPYSTHNATRSHAVSPPTDPRYAAPHYPPPPGSWTPYERAPSSTYGPDHVPRPEYAAPPPPPPQAPQLVPPPPPSMSSGASYYAPETRRYQPPVDPWQPWPHHHPTHHPQAPVQVPVPPPPSVPPLGSISSASYHSASSNHTYFESTMVKFGQEKEKMLRGLPYKHWLDPMLIEDRRDCRIALEKFNAWLCAPSRDDDPERARLEDKAKLRQFREVLHPGRTTRLLDGVNLPWEHRGPVGQHGIRLIISPPFACMYGYNLRFGHDVVIERNCYFEDSGMIDIGDRVTIGCDVRFLCMVTNLDTRSRKGSQASVCAGAIRVEDDVTICAGALIMPYRTIGKGAMVGPGSVVTKDVLPNTLVEGSPAKFVRYLHEKDSRESDYETHTQNEAVKQRMNNFVNNGYRERSPRPL